LTVRDVYAALAERMKSDSKYIQQALMKLATPEEGEMLLALPASVKEFAEKFNMSEEEAEKKLNDLKWKGVAMFLKKKGQYAFIRNAGQFHDTALQAAWNHLDEPIRGEILEIFEWHRQETIEKLAKIEPKPKEAPPPGPHFRVIPIREAVKDDIEMLHYEDIVTTLKNATDFCVVNCPCSMYRVEQGLCDKPLEICMQFTPGAVIYAEEEKVGRRITLEEALEIQRRAGEAGLVPTVFGGDKLGLVCNCCGDCCSNISVQVQSGYPLVEKSRYQSFVDQELCNGCQICVERCYFKAIDMVKVPGTRILKASIDAEKCHGCGACVVKCPTEALTLKVVRPKEHIPLIEMAHLQP